MSSEEEDQPSVPLAEVGRYRRLKAARERGLVVAAMELPHWIERGQGAWILRVEESARDRVIRMGENPALVFNTGCPSIDLAAEWSTARPKSGDHRPAHPVVRCGFNRPLMGERAVI